MTSKLLKSKRGSTEILAFILVLPFLLMPALNTIHMLGTIFKYEELRQAGRAAIIAMEMKGGLTEVDTDGIKSHLIGKGFSGEHLNIHYTPYPVDYGAEVSFLIEYTHPMIFYNLSLGGLTKEEGFYEMSFGPVTSLSKKYFRS